MTDNSTRGDDADAPNPTTAADTGPVAAPPADSDDDLVSAARSAMARPTRRSGGGGGRSLALLAVVVICVFGLGVYGVVWSAWLASKNERIELRELERRRVMADTQHRNLRLKFGPDTDVLPAGVVYKPLAPNEKTRRDTLAARHPPQFEPNPIEQALIEETARLEAAGGPAGAAGPATQP